MLKVGGLKVTPQRMVIMQYLANTPEHPGIDAIYEAVRAQLPAMSLATIYKTLETLRAAHLVHRVMTDDGKSRYDANVLPHSHLYCTHTGRIGSTLGALGDFGKLYNKPQENFVIRAT
jgi:Fur family peroxide stress response transcriptional regulator